MHGIGACPCNGNPVLLSAVGNQGVTLWGLWVSWALWQPRTLIAVSSNAVLEVQNALNKNHDSYCSVGTCN